MGVITQREASAALVSVPCAVLFVDTCILLDIVRAPIRDTINANSAAIAQRLCALSRESPRGVWLVTSETVRDEWLENIADVKLEVAREILKIEKRRKHFLSAAGAANNIQYTYGDSEAAIRLEDRLESISQALLDECLIITPESAHIISAMQRVKQYRPPARRGKSEAKDCEIFEVFLGLCADSRAGGFCGPVLFASSNTTDYAGDNAAGIKKDLGQVNGQHVSNLPWAMALIEAALKQR